MTQPIDHEPSAISDTVVVHQSITSYPKLDAPCSRVSCTRITQADRLWTMSCQPLVMLPHLQVSYCAIPTIGRQICTSTRRSQLPTPRSASTNLDRQKQIYQPTGCLVNPSQPTSMSGILIPVNAVLLQIRKSIH